jgi:hypothetical protein
MADNRRSRATPTSFCSVAQAAADRPLPLSSLAGPKEQDAPAAIRLVTCPILRGGGSLRVVRTGTRLGRSIGGGRNRASLGQIAQSRAPPGYPTNLIGRAWAVRSPFLGPGFRARRCQ